MPEGIFIEPTISSKNGASVVRRPESTTKELRSERAMEIISHRPGFLVRWGNVFFLIILLIMIVACWFIYYPDVVQSTAKLTSINAPKPIVTLTGGKLVKLFVSENQFVNQGAVIGFIESTANHNQILKVAIETDSIERYFDDQKFEKIQDFQFDKPSQLGELQPFHQTFMQAYFSFRNYLSDGFYEKKKNLIMKDFQTLKNAHSYLIQQKSLQEEDLKLTQKTFEANQTLKKGNVISDFDYRAEQSKLINKKLSLPQINLSIVNNVSQQNEKRKELMELENTIRQQSFIFQQALLTYKSQIIEWKRKYLLIASTSGKVAFASFLQENQQLQANQTICYINPENSQYFAEVVVPQINFGKVEVGQRVLLKFSSYPFQEYGIVRGRIAFISNIPSENGYLAKVELIDGLTTTNQKVIHFREGLTAQAEIIAKDLRLLERFYYEFKKQINASN
jgi:HlyD family secretion protein